MADDPTPTPTPARRPASPAASPSDRPAAHGGAPNPDAATPTGEDAANFTTEPGKPWRARRTGLARDPLDAAVDAGDCLVNGVSGGFH